MTLYGMGLELARWVWVEIGFGVYSVSHSPDPVIVWTSYAGRDVDIWMLDA